MSKPLWSSYNLTSLVQWHKSWYTFFLLGAYLQEDEKPQGIWVLWTEALNGIPTLSPSKSLETKLFSDVPKESFHHIAEIVNNSFIDEKCWLPVQWWGKLWWHCFLDRSFRYFFFLTMKPSGFPLAHMNEWTVQPFATAKILLILFCRWKDEEPLDLLCIFHCREMSLLSSRNTPRLG